MRLNRSWKCVWYGAQSTEEISLEILKKKVYKTSLLCIGGKSSTSQDLVVILIFLSLSKGWEIFSLYLFWNRHFHLYLSNFWLMCSIAPSAVLESLQMHSLIHKLDKHANWLLQQHIFNPSAFPRCTWGTDCDTSPLWFYSIMQQPS